MLPATTAFGWSRTSVDPALLGLLADPQWQAYVVFPGEFAAPERVVTALLAANRDADGAAAAAGLDERPPDHPHKHPHKHPLHHPLHHPIKRPLFVLLDGTWSEARKIFRKSPYLSRLPVLSLQPAQPSTYRLRRSSHAHHFCTAEVASLCLALAGDLAAAQALSAYLEVFSNRYLRARQSLPPDPKDLAVDSFSVG